MLDKDPLASTEEAWREYFGENRDSIIQASAEARSQYLIGLHLLEEEQNASFDFERVGYIEAVKKAIVKETVHPVFYLR